ncbi:peptidase C13 family protein, partial [Klebsiella aerogenes]|uniref:hypothetical protein n=1 Tax=Klebsiella aerogenes TaxID=548 RepID=UPI000F993FB4
GFEPSEPQMVIGSLMETALPAFEQVLFAKTRPALANMTNQPNSVKVTQAPDTANAIVNLPESD